MLQRLKSALSVYSQLPGELRAMASMALILLPLGAAGGAFFVFKQMFGLETPGAILAVLGVLLGLALLIGLIIMTRAWLARARQNRMARALTSAGSSGPQAMGGADIRQMNDKFRRSVEEMRRHSYRVYDMPWYIVVGDSGCGKTKLINECGLQFPLGRPEEITGDGITLGTKDYNWWFTENMIFVDMAGKLVNPSEEAGHRTWLGMLKIIARGRPACPINGALVCVSVEDLLDNPEKRLRDAENMQLRLRELQLHLGVTFPTYIVVTKCDLVPGFVEFFRKVGRDLLLRNQIAGWSRPGAFNASYNPDSFAADFSDLCRRLHALRLKRLHDDEDEPSLENAYTFPEHFRELGGPLHEYITTVFPQLKNTRGVSQLLFRGVYFTSATQDARLWTRESGVADVLKGLDKLYEKPEPHFLKDLLIKKVAPEQGLVYRNEAQLRRNKTLAWGLGVGSVLLTVASVWGFMWSYRAFARVIADPRQHAQEAARPTLKPAEITADEALRRAGQLTRDIQALEQNTWVRRILSTFVNPSGPLDDLQRIRAGIFEHKLLPVLASQTSAALAESGAGDSAPDESLLAAARAQLKWSAAAGAAAAPACLSFEDLAAMSRLAAAPEGARSRFYDWTVTLDGPAESSATPATSPAAEDSPPPAAHEIRFATVAQSFAQSLQNRSAEIGNPARAFGGTAADRALAVIQRVLSGRAELQRFLRERWSDDLRRYAALARAAGDANKAYSDFLVHARSAEQVASVSAAEAFGDGYLQIHGRFARALDQVHQGEALIAPKDLWALLLRHRREGWQSELRGLREALTACGLNAPGELAALDERLDGTFAATLRELGVAGQTFAASNLPADSSAAAMPELFDGMPGRLRHIYRPAGTGQRFTVTDEAQSIRERLAQYAARFEHAARAPLSLAGLLDELRRQPGATGAAEGPADPLLTPLKLEGWEAAEFHTEAERVYRLAARWRATRMLHDLVALAPADRPWGIAELADGWNAPQSSVYQMEFPRGAVSATTVPATQSAPRSAADLLAATDERAATTAPVVAENIPAAATAPFVAATAVTIADILSECERLGPTLLDSGLADQVLRQFGDGWGRYAARFADAWRQAVRDPELPNVVSGDWTSLETPSQPTRDRWGRYIDEFTANVIRAGFYEPPGSPGSGRWLIAVGGTDIRAKALREGAAAFDAALAARFEGIRMDALRQGSGMMPAPLLDIRRTCEDAWRATQDEVGFAQRLLRADPVGGAAPPQSAFRHFEQVAERFPWRQLPALQEAVKYEQAACSTLAAEAARQLSRFSAAPLSQRCRELSSFRRRFDSINDLLSACRRPDDARALASLERICSLRGDIDASSVVLEPLTEQRTRDLVIDLNSQLQGRGQGKAFPLADCFSQYEVTLGTRSQVQVTNREHTPLPDVRVAACDKFALQLTPAAGVTTSAQPVRLEFADPAVDLLSMLKAENRLDAKNANVTFVTLYVIPVQRNGVDGYCFLGLGWRFDATPQVLNEYLSELR